MLFSRLCPVYSTLYCPVFYIPQSVRQCPECSTYTCISGIKKLDIVSCIQVTVYRAVSCIQDITLSCIQDITLSCIQDTVLYTGQCPVYRTVCCIQDNVLYTEHCPVYRTLPCPVYMTLPCPLHSKKLFSPGSSFRKSPYPVEASEASRNLQTEGHEQGGA